MCFLFLHILFIFLFLKSGKKKKKISFKLFLFFFLLLLQCVQFHPNSNYIATGSSDRTIRLWDVLSGNCVRFMTGHKVIFFTYIISYYLYIVFLTNCNLFIFISREQYTLQHSLRVEDFQHQLVIYLFICFVCFYQHNSFIVLANPCYFNSNNERNVMSSSEYY